VELSERPELKLSLNVPRKLESGVDGDNALCEGLRFEEAEANNAEPESTLIFSEGGGGGGGVSSFLQMSLLSSMSTTSSNNNNGVLALLLKTWHSSPGIRMTLCRFPVRMIGE